MTKGLNDKQLRFIEEYLVDLNATQAAIRAGYSERTAYRQGADLLKKPQVAEAIAERNQARSERTQLDADWVLKQAEHLYEQCLIKDDHRTAIKALELVGKHASVGAWKERIEHSADEALAERIMGARRRVQASEA